ncbi:reverse transcriptase family protein, partial [Klebsiella pneumoniae]|nr:reverse transcriptase family protein [Klebsiella pneumoniae]
NHPTSYRPISLLMSLGKLYERLLYKRLRDFVSSKGILIDEQFGFRTNHSCVQQVHRLTEHILVGLNRPKPLYTGALFFDVAKAFDKVWHNGLIFKLFNMGVPDSLVLIIRDFLSNRSFRYRVEGTRSSPRSLTAGVPQGSVLSPL